MKLTITTLTDLVITVDVSSDMDLESFRALCALEANLNQKTILLFFNGNLLNDKSKTLSFYGIQDGDMLLIKDSSSMNENQLPSIDLNFPSSASNDMVPDDRREAENIFATLRSNPEQVATLRINNPELTRAFEIGIDEFVKVLRKQQQARSEAEQRRIRLLLADPFDSEAQKMIAEEIRQQQINSNMETAIEYLPESFAEVTMLYIDCKVNGFPIKAFVDSGAQTTIMSKACAERCNILRLIDDRFSGIARGVGTQKVLGKIHLVQLEINGVFVPCSFMVLEHQPMDMLLGLDMLRRFQCSINLKSNVLHIGTTGTETPFLSESEIPSLSKLNSDEDLQKALQDSLNSMNNNMNSETQISTPSSGISQSSSSSSNTRHSETVIQELVSMGFKREQVIYELDAFNGDKNQAMVALLAKAIVVPDKI